MKDMMRHRGYFGSVHYDDEDRIFFGKIEFIRALVSYEWGKTSLAGSRTGRGSVPGGERIPDRETLPAHLW